jgi:hypothetical protein
MRSTYVRYKGGCAIDAQKTWAQMQWRGKGRGLEVERRLGCGELGIAWTGSKAPGHAQIGECGKPCSGPTRRPPQRLADRKQKHSWRWRVVGSRPRNRIMTAIEECTITLLDNSEGKRKQGALTYLLSWLPD